MAESQAELIARLRSEVEAGKADIRMRRERRQRGEEPEGWEVPPPRRQAHQRSPQAGADSTLRAAMQSIARAEVEQLIDRKIEQALARFADATGAAIAKAIADREAAQALATRSMIHRELERAEEKREAAAPSIRAWAPARSIG